MQTAQDVMETQPPTITATASVDALARQLVEARMPGICVVDDAGQLIGVVTEMDLIFQEKKPQLPTTFAFMEGVFVFGLRKSKQELAKITGTTVHDIMSQPPVTVTPDTPLSDIASLMIEEHFSIVPVVSDGALIGVITRSGVLRAAFLHET